MNLQPVDFKAVAAKGAYVYCYLRENGTPYYVGIASQGQHRRPFERHSCKAPTRQRHLARVMRSSLTWEEACQWERFYIKRYGRKDLGTGILLNKTDGGEGSLNPSTEARMKMGANRGKELTAETKAKMSAVRKGVTKTEEHRKKIGQSQKGKEISLATRTKLSAPKSEAHKAKLSEIKTRQGAEALGLPFETYSLLSVQQRDLLRKRYSRGKRGEDLVAGILAAA